MTVLLFNDVCIYDQKNNKTRIYGQYNKAFKKIFISKGIKFNYIRSPEQQKKTFDFFLELCGKISFIDTIIFVFKEDYILKNVYLTFPFDLCSLSLNSNSAIIVTMCKCLEDSNRLYEWIEYNLNLGFSGIVIFNNDDEPDEFCKERVYNRYNDRYTERIFILDFNYKPIKNIHWNSIQKVSFNIGVNAFINKCSKIALVDTDEFIYLPKNPSMNIEHFLLEYPKQPITIQSNIITNRLLGDTIDNNVLDIGIYLGEDKYTKVILDTVILKERDKNDGVFFNTVSHHEQRGELLLDKEEIIHYHYWLNHRKPYHKDMKKMTLLKDIKSKQKKWSSKAEPTPIIYDIWDLKSTKKDFEEDSPDKILIDINKPGQLNAQERMVLKRLISRSGIDFSTLKRDYELLGNRIANIENFFGY